MKNNDTRLAFMVVFSAGIMYNLDMKQGQNGGNNKNQSRNQSQNKSLRDSQNQSQQTTMSESLGAIPPARLMRLMEKLERRFDCFQHNLIDFLTKKEPGRNFDMQGEYNSAENFTSEYFENEKKEIKERISGLETNLADEINKALYSMIALQGNLKTDATLALDSETQGIKGIQVYQPIMDGLGVLHNRIDQFVEGYKALNNGEFFVDSSSDVFQILTSQQDRLQRELVAKHVESVKPLTWRQRLSTFFKAQAQMLGKGQMQESSSGFRDMATPDTGYMQENLDEYMRAISEQSLYLANRYLDILINDMAYNQQQIPFFGKGSEADISGYDQNPSYKIAQLYAGFARVILYPGLTADCNNLNNGFNNENASGHMLSAKI